MEWVISSLDDLQANSCTLLLLTIFTNALIQIHYVHVVYMHTINRAFNNKENGKEEQLAILE